MIVLLEGSPVSTEELWSSDRVTIGFLVHSLTKALLHQLLNFARRPGLGRFLVVPNFFHLRMMVFLGTFNNGDIFWYPSPDLCLDTIRSWSSTYNSFDLMAWFLLWHALSTVGSYTYWRVCAFPNHVQSTEFTTVGLQSSCRNISRTINGNRMQMSSISSLIANDLNTYVNKVFLFLFFINLQKCCFVITGYCV